MRGTRGMHYTQQDNQRSALVLIGFILAMCLAVFVAWLCEFHTDLLRSAFEWTFIVLAVGVWIACPIFWAIDRLRNRH